MDSLTNQLSQLFAQAFVACGYDPSLGKVVVAQQAEWGDFQCNGAFAAAKASKQNPRQVAQQIVDALPGREPFRDISIAGAGFINLTLTNHFLAQFVQQMAADPKLGIPPLSPAGIIVVDYGGANVAKPLHVGHLRAGIIGESLKRLARYLGQTVIGDVHLGDWGLQMGMLITEVQRRMPDLPYFDPHFSGPYPAGSPVGMDDLQAFYPAATARCKADPQALEAARLATKELQAGRPGYRALWQHFVNVSVAALKADYDLLNVHFDLWLGESDADPRIPAMIERLKTAGQALESEGALIIPIAQPGDKKEFPPMILLKSDGAALYSTTDLATIEQRVADFQPNDILYVVDNRQSLHFAQLFRAAHKTGIAPAGTNLEHIAFGTMNGPDGKPFKTRAGGVMNLRDLIQMITDKASERLQEIEAAQDYPPAERDEIARQVGLAALKFADLSNNPATDYIFDLDRFSAFEGRTGPYLLYTAVRIKSILRKAEGLGLKAGALLAPAGAEERALMLQLTRLADAAHFAFDSRAPNHLCDYIYNLALSFNRFYRDNHILREADSGRQASWLALVQICLAHLQLVLELLAIPIPARM